MVMKYAVSEKSVIDLKKEIQLHDNKVKDAIREKESMQAKLKVVIADKAKLQQVVDSKVKKLSIG